MSTKKRSAEKYALVTPKAKDARLDPKAHKYIVWFTWCSLGECHPVYLTSSPLDAQRAVDAIYSEFAVWRAAGGEYHSRDPADGFAFFFTETTPTSPVLRIDVCGEQVREVWVEPPPNDMDPKFPWYSYRSEDIGTEVTFKVHKYLPEEFCADDLRDFSFASDVELCQDDKVSRAYWVGLRSLSPNTLEMLRRIYPKAYTTLRHEREFPEEGSDQDDAPRQKHGGESGEEADAVGAAKDTTGADTGAVHGSK